MISITFIICATILAGMFIWQQREKSQNWPEAADLIADRLSATSIDIFKLWIQHQPSCTQEDFERLVKQVNTLTESMSTVQQTSDSLRSAISMSKMRVGG